MGFKQTQEGTTQEQFERQVEQNLNIERPNLMDMYMDALSVLGGPFVGGMMQISKAAALRKVAPLGKKAVQAADVIPQKAWDKVDDIILRDLNEYPRSSEILHSKYDPSRKEIFLNTGKVSRNRIPEAIHHEVPHALQQAEQSSTDHLGRLMKSMSDVSQYRGQYETNPAEIHARLMARLTGSKVLSDEAYDGLYRVTRTQALNIAEKSDARNAIDMEYFIKVLQEERPK